MANSAVVGLLRILLQAETAQATAEIQKFNSSAKVLTRDLQTMGRQVSDIGMTLTKAFTVPLAGVGIAASKLAIDFESSFAGVRKTVNATEGELNAMALAFRNLAKTIPVNVNELNRLGEAAGALGIPKAQIVDFTRVMAQLGVTTNLTADQAAESIAKIQNIFGAAGKDTERFASTLVALGNDGASTETQIVEMATRIAGAGHAINMTQGEVLAFASALSSVGIEAEMGGSAISRVFIDIASAVSKGGESVEGFARVANMNVAEFSRLFKEDAASAVNAFITGLGNIKQSGGDLLGTLESLGFQEIRVRDTLLRTAGAGDLLTRALNLQKKAWQENSALTEEAQKRFESTASQLTLLWNRVKDVGITLGNALLPSIKLVNQALSVGLPVLEAVVQGFAMLPAPIQLATVGLLALAAAAGPVLVLLGQMAIGASTLTAAFTAKGVATKALTAELGVLRLAMLALPFVAIVAGAGAVAAAIASLRDRYRELGEQAATSARNLEAMGLAGRAQVAAQLAEKERQLAEAVRDGNKALAARLANEVEAIKNDQARLAIQDTITLAIKRGADANINYAAAVKFNAEWVARQTEQSKAAADQTTRTAHATQNLTDKIDAANAKVAEADKQIAQLSATAREKLTQAIKSGAFTMKELSEATGLSEMALDRFEASLKKSEKSSNKTAKEVQKLTTEMQSLVSSLSGADAIKAAEQMLIVLQRLPPVQMLTVDAQRRINAVMGDALDVYRALGVQAPDAINRIYFATLNLLPVTQGLGREFQQIGAQTWLDTWTRGIPVVQGLGAEFANVGQRVAQGVGIVRTLGDEIRDGLGRAVRSLVDGVSSAFTDMLIGARSFWDSFKQSALNTFAQILDAFINGLIKKMLGSLAGLGGNSWWGQLLQGVTGVGAPGMAGGLPHGGILQGLLGIGGASGIGVTTGVPAGLAGVGATGIGAGGVAVGTGGGAATGGAGFLASGLGTALGVGGIGAGGFGLGFLLSEKFGRTAGTIAGGAGGAATGALIGTAVFPGIGTGFGALIGGLSGVIGGLLGGGDDGDKARDKFIAQFGGRGTGEGSGFGTLQGLLGKLGPEGNALFKGLLDADSEKKSVAAIDKIIAAFNSLKFKQIEVDDATKTLLKGYKDLQAQGLTQEASIRQQAGSYSALYNQILATGTQAPAALHPIFLSLVEMGLLVDKNGEKVTDLGSMFEGAAAVSTIAAEKLRVALQEQIQALDTELKSLSDSIASEAPEEVMGVVEAQARERIASIEREREALIQQLEAASAQAGEAAEQHADDSMHAWDPYPDHVRAQFQEAWDEAKRIAEATGRDLLEVYRELSRDLMGNPIRIPVEYDMPDTAPSYRVRTPVEGGDDAGPVWSAFAGGGIVPQYAAMGKRIASMVNWRPLGTDTVPAMLTPGELVLNEAQQRNLADSIHAARVLELATSDGRPSGDMYVTLDMRGAVIDSTERAREVGEAFATTLAQNPTFQRVLGREMRINTHGLGSDVRQTATRTS